MFRIRTVVVFVAAVCVAAAAQKPAGDPVKALGAFLGKWHTEGTFANGNKVESELECRWSPKNHYLICEQAVSMANVTTHQLTVYGYDPAMGKYSYSSFQENAPAPSTGMLDITGNTWTYNSTVENNGKKTQVRTTNEFTDPKTEVFKVVLSDDDGVIWKPVLQGTARKVAD